MESLQSITLDLNNIISNLKKVGKASRTLNWLVLQQDCILSLESTIDMIDEQEVATPELGNALEATRQLVVTAKV